ncbi:MAG: helix-turn-helix domain-containing protein [Dehalococcoidia bacterium]|nr:helix-turn-helix domain-containing protein [Dehalococcoidia bacterium]
MREHPSSVTVRHAALVAELTPEERAALAAELLAANVREAVSEALARTARTPTEAGGFGLGSQESDGAPTAMNPEQAAKYCGVGINAMRGLLRAGSIPARRSGRRWIVRREALDEWMRNEEEAEHRQRLDLLAHGRGRRARTQVLGQYVSSLDR